MMMDIPTRAVKAVILNKDHKILFLQRNPKTRDSSVWDLPGGLVEYGEDEKSALAREVAEELGLECSVIKKAGSWQFYRRHDKKTVYVQNYLCRTEDGNIVLSDEHISYSWVMIKDIRDYPVKDISLYISLEKFTGSQGEVRFG